MAPNREYGIQDGYAIKPDGTLWQVLGSAQGPVQLGTDFQGLFQGGRHGVYALKTDGSIWALRHLQDPNNHYLPSPTSTLSRVGTDSGFVRVFTNSQYGEWVWAIKADGIPRKVDDGLTYGMPALGLVADMSNPDSEGYAAVLPDKTLWVSSKNLGEGCVAAQVPGNTYKPVPYQAGRGVATAASGGGTFAVVKTDGTLWTFGQGPLLGVGFIPMGTGMMSGYPAPICTPARIGTGYASVRFGSSSVAEVALALKQDGTLMAWGSKYVSVASDLPGHLPSWKASGTVLSPTQVSTDVTDYASGTRERQGAVTIIRKTDGSIWVSERPGIPSDWRQVATGF